ncbi:unnamed protein product [Pleuronectes platessa]|uniref:Uncharacterized protein n=1 Tax=Pleuronectes platessa TaxID=8262 RepID=A0A9N7YL53_PLEPL|nr:unnamed protein product [Pleuronectes platessa]
MTTCGSLPVRTSQKLVGGVPPPVPGSTRFYPVCVCVRVSGSVCVDNEQVVLPARFSGANSPVEWKRKRCHGGGRSVEDSEAVHREDSPGGGRTFTGRTEDHQREHGGHSPGARRVHREEAGHAPGAGRSSGGSSVSAEPRSDPRYGVSTESVTCTGSP